MRLVIPQCGAPVMTSSEALPSTLKLLSFNIQVGINTQQYRHYFTRSWQHLLPFAQRMKTLNRIANVLTPFDIIALQEVDGGSLRSGFVNQTEYLAYRSHHPYWYQQLNRNLGALAQHSNGLISRFAPLAIEDHKLPGIIPGRGAIVSMFGNPNDPLVVVMLHLALSRKTQDQQLSYVREVVQNYQHVVMMGDMNTHAERLLHASPLQSVNLRAAHNGQHTWPSWRPVRSWDHILLSSTLKVREFSVLDEPIADHLPIAVEIEVPESVRGKNSK